MGARGPKPGSGQAKGAAGKGREVGSKNKITKDIKEMIREALHKVGGVEYLVEQAGLNAPSFLALLGKILPKEVSVDGQLSVDQTTRHVLDPRILDDDQRDVLRGILLARIETDKESS